MWEQLVPDYIRNLEPYRPGKPIWEVQREHGLDQVVKLASNENPRGPSPLALKALEASLAGCHRYPDVGGHRLRAALAERHGLGEENVVLGNGSEGIMAYILRTFLHDEDEILSVRGTFVGFMVLSRGRATPPVSVPLSDYHFDLEALAQAVTSRTKIVYLCNPNNPTGTIFTRQDFERFLDRLPPRILVILDEAYHEYALEDPTYPDSLHYRHDQVITLRTFSKAHGLAGIRIGYGIAHPTLIGNLLKVKLPFEPGTPAQEAGLGALADEAFLAESLAMNREGLAFFRTELGRLGLRCVPSRANFQMVPMGSPEEARRVFEECLKRGVILRTLERFGLPECLRITVGLPEECRRCVEVLEEVLALP